MKYKRWKLPKQIFKLEEFRELLKIAEYIIVKRNENVKIKLRTPQRLYVFITSKEEADKILKGVKIEIREIS